MCAKIRSDELINRFNRVKALATTLTVSYSEAKRMAKSVSGLAKLSGYSRMHVHRLVKSGKVQLGTPEALRWSWYAAQRNYPPNVTPLNLRRNHPARRAMMALLNDCFAKRVKPVGKSADMKMVRLIARIHGEPKPEPSEFRSFVSKSIQLQESKPDLIRLVGITRRRKQVDYAEFLLAQEQLKEKQERLTLRNIGRQLNVNASTVSRWFAPGGHLHEYRKQLAMAGAASVSGSGHSRNGRPLRCTP